MAHEDAMQKRKAGKQAKVLYVLRNQRSLKKHTPLSVN